MKLAPTPENEKERLSSLYELGLLDTEPEERFDSITRIATQIFNVPISTLTFVDAEREWFKSHTGLLESESKRTISFCGHALLSNGIFVIPDTKKDKRFADNPMVIGKPYIRFYAGVPIMSADKKRVGVFCIKDIKPRIFSKREKEILKGLATWAELEVNSRNLSLALSERKKIETEFKIQTQGLENEKKAAQNVLEDLNIEKSKVEMAKAKEEAILLSIGDGLIATDEKGVITLFNKTAEKLLGKKKEEVVGKIFSDCVIVEDEKGNPLSPDKHPINMALTAGITTTTLLDTTFYYVRKDKTRFPVAVMVTLIVLEKKIIGTIQVFRDITREKEIDKAKSEFVSLTSHQLRTPLSTVSWYTEMLLTGEMGKINEKQKKYLNEIYKGNQRMVLLVNALLNVSRLELGAFVIEPSLTSVAELIQNVVKEQKIQINEKKMKLSFSFEKGIPLIQVDSKLLGMVVQNLLSNAIKFTPEKGTVTLGLRFLKRNACLDSQKMSEDCVVIIVSDTGYGIPKAQQDKIFTKLFRADNAREKDTEGTGLGLYIVKSITEHLRGKIWFTSPTLKNVPGGEEDRGTTFYVALPMQGAEKRSP